MLDASVTLAWCFRDEGGEYANAVLAALRTRDAVAACHWGLEVTNGLLVAERRGRIEGKDVPRLANLVLALPIVVDPVARRRPFADVHRLASAHELTAYDAAYLELAVRHGRPLATLDGRLRAAARAEGIEVFAPAE